MTGHLVMKDRTFSVAALGPKAAPFSAGFVLLIFFAITAGAQPVPVLYQPLIPSAVAPGGSGFTLTVNGTGFDSNSVVYWNGSPRATTFVSSSRVTAAILASDIASPSTASITVAVPGRVASNAVFLPIHAPTASVAFNTTDYPIGNLSSALTADFRNDGILDLALAADNISVMLGNGNGTFQNEVTYGYGIIGSLALGDFNGDGNLDLAGPSGINYATSVVVLLGNGNGTFQPQQNYPDGNGGGAILTADFQGRGILDLAVVKGGNDSSLVSILPGNGDGSFQPHLDYNAGGKGASGGVVGDFNGDGILDLAVSNSLSNQVAILLGNGDGGFQKPIRNSAGPSPGDIAVADVNGDGILDLVVANQTSATVSILLGKGDGTFAAPVTYPVAANAVSVQVGDFNQDGNLDLAVGTQGPTLVDVLFGNGDGTFQPAISSPSVTGDLVSGNLTIGDFNQDGLLDVVVSGFYDVSGNYTSTLAVMLQTTAVGNTPTKTKLTFSPNPSIYGQSVTLAGSVTSTSGTPTGVVAIFKGPTEISNGTLASGSASIAVSSPAVGKTSFTAAYQGSSTFAPSTSAAVSQVVNQATTAITLTSSAHPPYTIELITYTASVTGEYGGAATGTVTFRDNGMTLGTASLSGGKASYTTSYSTPGTHAIAAMYSGDSNNTGSMSSVLTVNVKTPTAPYPSITTLTSSNSSAHFGQSVTFTATVTSLFGSIPDGGLVTFYDGRPKVAVEIGIGTTSGGVATFTASALADGTHFITATYAANAAFQSSHSSINQGVYKYTTSTTISSSANPACGHQDVTFTAVVSSNGGPTPTGQVHFTGIGDVTLSGGQASISERVGTGFTHFGVTAEYEGDDYNAASQSPVLVEHINYCGG